MPIPQALNIIPFAEHMETIKALYMSDADFKTLWDDYCTSKIKSEKLRWRLLNNIRSELEYAELSLALKKEIEEYLRKIG
jgi:hypothetical protein